MCGDVEIHNDSTKPAHHPQNINNISILQCVEMWRYTTTPQNLHIIHKASTTYEYFGVWRCGETITPPLYYMDRVKRIWYLSPMRAAKVQASLRIRAVSPEPSLLAHTSSESRGTFRQKAISLVPLNGWACAVKICHDGMLEDTNSLDGAHMNYRKTVAIL